MSDLNGKQEGKSEHHHPQIDDPGLFLTFGSNPSIEQQRDEVQNQNGERSESLSNDEEYVPQALEEEEIKNDENDLYEPESANLQDQEEEEKSVAHGSLKQLSERPPIQEFVKTFTGDEEKSSKTGQKKKRRSKKKVVDSQEDEYSGEYVLRKKTKLKDNRKPIKRSQSGRQRGKPRGRGAHASRLSQVKKEYIYPDETNTEKGLQKLRRKPEATVSPPNYIMAPFTTNWRVAEENQQDWDSQNASIWSESVNKRSQFASDIISLIEGNPENIVSLIANLPPLLYTTFH